MLFLSAVFWLQSASFKISMCRVYTQLYMIPVEEGKSAGADAINTNCSISVTALILCFFYFVPGQSERVQRAAGATHGMTRTIAEIIQMFVQFSFFCIVKLVYFML